MKSTAKGVVIMHRISYQCLLIGLVASSFLGSVQAIPLYYTLEGDCCVLEGQNVYDITGLQSVDHLSFVFLADNDVGLNDIEQDPTGGEVGSIYDQTELMSGTGLIVDKHFPGYHPAQSGVDNYITIDDEEDRINIRNSRLIWTTISDTLPAASDSEPPASLLLGIGLLGIAWRQRIIVVKSRIKKRV
jgi:hypothetical protein